MKLSLYNSRLLMLVAGLATGISACTTKDTTPQNDLSLTTTSLGAVLTGENSKTLYFFAPDANGNANCTGACTDTWPVFYKETPLLGTGLNAADFTTITRTDGAKQTAYKGWPLYYFKNDAKSGDVNGENVGSTWFVAKTEYTITMGAGQLKGNDGKNYTFDTKEGTGTSIYFTDQLGRTLYAFANDKKSKNNYTKADMSNNATWPLFEVASLKEIPSTLKKTDFGTIDVFGHTQLTYKGWPLYYFGPDAGLRGNTKGVSVPRPGVWPVVNASSPDAPL